MIKPSYSTQMYIDTRILIQKKNKATVTKILKFMDIFQFALWASYEPGIVLH